MKMPTQFLTNKKFIKPLVIIGVILVSIIIVLVILSYVINPNNYKTYIANKFAKNTGRQIVLSGPITLSIFPEIKVHASNVSITNPAQLPSGNFIEVGSLDAHIAIMPLLKGTIAIHKSMIEDLHVNLIKKGQLNNWSFEVEGKGKQKSSDINLVLRTLLVKNAVISYNDMDTNENIHTNSFNLALNKNHGAIDFRSKQINLNKATLDLNDKFHTRADLSITIKPNIFYTGNFFIDSFSLNKVAEVLNMDLPNDFKRPIYSNISMASNIKGGDNYLNLHDINLILNKTNITGQVVISHTPYKIKQTLKIDQANMEDFVDLNGFKLKIESTTFVGVVSSESDTNLSTLSGKEKLSISKITLYGFGSKLFSQQVTKVVKDISGVHKLVTYTQTNATVKEIKKSIDKIQGQRQKNYSETTNLGSLNVNLVAKNGDVTIPTCSLDSPSIEGVCGGYIDMRNNKINVLIQVRLLSQGEQNLINYIYFPYYLKGNFSNIDDGLEWMYVIKQTSNYYSTSKKDKPILNKAVSDVSALFKAESK